MVTGASRGIGFECARALATAGARVVLLARGDATIADAAEEIGRESVGVTCDVGNAASVARAAATARKVFGGAPDILVSNAGAFSLAPADETSIEEFDRVLRVNLSGVFAMTRAFLPDMKRRGSGHIVTIGSVADRHAFPGNAAYAASKFGARGLHEVLRAELGGSGVRVSLISPSQTDTSLWDPIDPDTREGFTKRADMLSPDAVADAVLWAVTRPPHISVDELRLSRA